MNSFSPQDFAVEMAVVLRRQEWLTAVLTGDEDAIANLHKKLVQESSKGGSSSSESGWSDIKRLLPHTKLYLDDCNNARYANQSRHCIVSDVE